MTRPKFSDGKQRQNDQISQINLRISFIPTLNSVYIDEHDIDRHNTSIAPVCLHHGSHSDILGNQFGDHDIRFNAQKRIPMLIQG